MANHPTVADLLGNAERWRADCARFSDPGAFAKSMDSRVASRHPDTSYMLGRLGIIVQPKDRTAIIDPDKPAAKAFRVGACLGFGVVEYCFGDRTDEKLSIGLERTRLAVDHEDPQEEDHLLGELVWRRGLDAFAETGPYRDILEGWEDAITPEVSLQTYLKTGFGFVIRLGVLAIAEHEDRVYQARLEAMAIEADAGFSDEEFESFLKSLPSA